jgi:hypothetical protein
MKSQRRHELQQNILNAELAKSVKFLKEKKTTVVWAVTLVVAAVLAGFLIINNIRSRHLRDQALYDRLTVSPLTSDEEFIDGMNRLAAGGDKRLAALANVQLGNYFSKHLLFAGGAGDQAEQKELADQAASYYQKAIQDFPEQRLAVAEAHVGLAKLAEWRRDFATAAQEYQAVISMSDMAGQPVAVQAYESFASLNSLKNPVKLATTSSAPSAASKPAAKSAPPPATMPAAGKAATTKAAGETKKK